nr:translation initiation factor IF-2 [Saimiri boliviensis boliviensis]
MAVLPEAGSHCRMLSWATFALPDTEQSWLAIVVVKSNGLLGRVIVIISGAKFRPFDIQPPRERTDKPTGEEEPRQGPGHLRPGKVGNALVALGSRARPRSFPGGARRLPAEVRQVARVPGAAKSRRTESVAQLCCGTRTAGWAAPAVELRLPPRGSPAPRPRGLRGSCGPGEAREHLSEARAPARRFRSCARVRGPRSSPPGAAAAERRPHSQRRPQQRRPRAAGGDREGGGPAPRGERGEDRAPRAGRDAGAGLSSPASPRFSNSAAGA